MKPIYLIGLLLIGLAIIPTYSHATFFNTSFSKCITINPVTNNTFNNKALQLIINNTVMPSYPNNTLIVVSNSSDCSNTDSGDSALSYWFSDVNSSGLIGKKGNSYLWINYNTTGTNISIYYLNSTPVSSLSNINKTSIGWATQGIGNDFENETVGVATASLFNNSNYWKYIIAQNTGYTGNGLDIAVTSLAANNRQAFTFKNATVDGYTIVFDFKAKRVSPSTAVPSFEYYGNSVNRENQVYLFNGGVCQILNASTVGLITVAPNLDNTYYRIRMTMWLTDNTGYNNRECLKVNETNEICVNDGSDNYGGGTAGAQGNAMNYQPNAVKNITIDDLFITRTLFDHEYTFNFGSEKNYTAPADTCTPTVPNWALNLADNCTISGVNWIGSNWTIYSTGQGATVISNSNLTFSQRIYTTFIQWAYIVFNSATLTKR